MIDDYKYMYLYTPYIYRMMLWIFDFFCVLGVGWVLESWL